MTRDETAPSKETCIEAELFHPLIRPAYPRLVIVDDGQRLKGETVHLRHDSLTIGRKGCDLNFPAERLMSGKHCEVSIQQNTSGGWHWKLKDLNSRHGLFVRLIGFSVHTGNEWIAGGSKFLLGNCGGNFPLSDQPKLTNFVHPTPPADEIILISGYNLKVPPRSVKLNKKLKFGSAVTGEEQLSGDLFVDPYHFSLRLEGNSGWKVTDQKTLNGTWLRVREFALLAPCSFLAGEQRFGFYPNGSEIDI